MRKIWQFITAVKNATGNILFIALILLIIAVIAGVGQGGLNVPASAVLVLDPEGFIVEQKRPGNPFAQLSKGEGADDPETLGRDITEAIDAATQDARIKGMTLDLSKLKGSSLSQYDAIAKSLQAFKDAGKPVRAFGPSYSQSQYYLASFADKIYIDQDSYSLLGGVFLQGFGAYPLYMKSALDKLHVTMHVIKAGLYKDAAETLARDDMSDHSREATQELVDFLWASYLKTIAEQRNTTPAALAAYTNNYTLQLEQADNDPALLAVNAGLVDGVLSRVDWRREMQSVSAVDGDTYAHIRYQTYLRATRQAVQIETPAADKVAVIVAKGTILDGHQPVGTIGGDSIARLIRNARNTKSVKAIVLRIDSPGGSPSASELIRSELAIAQESGKPVVASMGGLAASGGYWIASTANRIVASETTVTGSIGVFALFPTIDQSLKKLGVHTDGVGTTNLTDASNPRRALSPMFEKTLQSAVSRTYNRFLTLVAEGRGLTMEEADQVAQGRVWTGARALEHGLVDAIGDVDLAIKSAATLAGIADYDVIYVEKPLSPRERLTQELLAISASLLPVLPGGIFNIVPEEFRTLASMTQSPAIYLQCVTCRITF